MKKMRMTALLLAVLLIAAALSPAASAECTRHRWVEATDEEPGFCYRCGVLNYSMMNRSFPTAPFYVQVLDTMNCRQYANMYSNVLTLVNPGVYTITEVQNGWGKLKSSGGWMCLTNPEYITVLASAGEELSIAPNNTPTFSISPAADLCNAQVGDVVSYGHYEQDDNLNNGAETIQWIVLAQSGGKLLLISKNCLECSPYNRSYAAVTWETCTLRGWLNETFLQSAFNSAEQNAIAYTTLRNVSNSTYGSDAGRDTVDRIFLLSYDEAVRYFNSDSARTAQSTKHAKNAGTYVSGYGNSWWWLRGPGEFTKYAALVGTEGNANNGGNYVDRITGAVRPAMWLTVE